MYIPGGVLPCWMRCHLFFVPALFFEVAGSPRYSRTKLRLSRSPPGKAARDDGHCLLEMGASAAAIWLQDNATEGGEAPYGCRGGICGDEFKFHRQC